MIHVDEVRSKIFNAVLAAEVSKGHLKWKVSDIARSTGVSRPLIYYHFGKSKEAILFECMNILAEEFYGLTSERKELVKQGNLLESLMRTRKMFVKNPSLVVFYQKWRMQADSPIRRKLLQTEERYQTKLSELFPQLSKVEVRSLHAVLHGIVSAPFLSTADVEATLNSVALAFRIKKAL